MHFFTQSLYDSTLELRIISKTRARLTEIKKMPAASCVGLALIVSAIFTGTSPAQTQVPPLPDPDVARLAELDAYWAEVSRSVKAGDFAAYQAGCHEKAVLVSGTKRISYPLSQALARWKKEFDDTRAGQRQSSVEFRFVHRYGDATTAHESGFFLYTSRDAGGEAKPEYVEFESLLVKEQGAWKIMMEYQKAKAEKAAWDALAPRG